MTRKNPASRQHQIDRFQKSLGDLIVLFLELKAKPGTTRIFKREIDDAVENLHKMIRSLPDLAYSRDSLHSVFDVIQKAIAVWRKLFRKDV